MTIEEKYDRFDSLLKGSLGRALRKMERERFERKKKFERNLAAAIIIGLSAILLCALAGAVIMGIVIAAVTGIAVACSRSSDARITEGRFKREIVPAVLEALAKRPWYDPDGVIAENEFNVMGLFRAPDRYEGMDAIQGFVGEVEFRLSYVHAIEEREELVTEEVSETVWEDDDDGNSTSYTEWHTETHWETHEYDIFKGMILSASMNKPFSGLTTVKGAGAFRMGSNVVRLEDPEWEQIFDVRSWDQIEARYILTPATMERIKALRERIGGFAMSFVNGQVYAALDGRSSPCGLPAGEIDAESAWTVYRRVKAILDIIEDLNLNTRIWTVGLDGPEENEKAA